MDKVITIGLDKNGDCYWCIAVKEFCEWTKENPNWFDVKINPKPISECLKH